MNNPFDDLEYSMGIHYDFSPSTSEELSENPGAPAKIDDESISDKSTFSSSKIDDLVGGESSVATKSIKIYDMSTYMDAEPVSLSEYGLSGEDVEKFIDGRLNILIILNIIPATISTIAPQVIKNMPDFVKKLLGHLYQARFETNESDCCVIEPLKQTVEEFTALGEEITRETTVFYPATIGLGVTLRAIKSSSISWFDLPRLYIATPFTLSGPGEPAIGINSCIVTDNDIIWLSFTNTKNPFFKQLGDQYAKAIYKKCDEKLNLPEGTTESSKTYETVAWFYENSQNEEYIATLDPEIQDKMRGCKEKIEAMAQWNGYDTVEEFIGVLQYLQYLETNTSATSK